MATQSWTDPDLSQTTMQSSDVLLFMRPITDASGNVSGYQPCNITAANFSNSIVAMGLLLLGANLPDAAPSGGGLFLNNGAFSYSAVSGSTSGTPLSAEALATSLRALLAASPPMGDTWNFDGFQNNAGNITQVDDGTSSSSGPSSQTPLTPEAFTASLKAALAVYPAMGSALNYQGFQNNAGSPQEVDTGE